MIPKERKETENADKWDHRGDRSGDGRSGSQIYQKTEKERCSLHWMPFRRNLRQEQGRKMHLSCRIKQTAKRPFHGNSHKTVFFSIFLNFEEGFSGRKTILYIWVYHVKGSLLHRKRNRKKTGIFIPILDFR